VRILAVVQGKWGQRIVDHLGRTAPTDWQILTWRGPAALPLMLDEPEAFLPDALPRVELLLVLTESAGMTDLAPDLARLCAAQAVIVPVDRRSWAPPGLLAQIGRRLEAMGIGTALPMPFCSLTAQKRQHALIQAFARRYGRPQIACTARNERIASCRILRETPCGNTRYIVSRLTDVPIEKAVEQAGLHHHYYPCWAGMETDPVQGAHTLLHVAATMAQKSVERALSGSGGNRD
jgi:hypothetical protein